MTGVLELTDIENGEDEAGSSRGHLVEQLMEVFWRLHTSRPVNATLAPLSVLGQYLAAQQSVQKVENVLLL